MTAKYDINGKHYGRYPIVGDPVIHRGVARGGATAFPLTNTLYSLSHLIVKLKFLLSRAMRCHYERSDLQSKYA